MKKIILCFVLAIGGLCMAQAASPNAKTKVKVVVDNDFCGDPDGLFQLVHQLLCTTCDIRGIVGGHLSVNAGFTNRSDQATESCEKARKVLQLMGREGTIKVVPGAEKGMEAVNKPADSEGARLIVDEARQCTQDKPLLVLCGASLTNIATAHLIDPSIDDKIVLIWIGGQEYTGVGSYPPLGYSRVEYNLNLCIPAAQVVFNQSRIRIWQVPRNAYRLCLYGLDEVATKVATHGKVGRYLYDSLMQTVGKCEDFGLRMGETYILGDSPLVLLSALQTGFEQDPSSSFYVNMAAPHINDDGSYAFNHEGRSIRVYYELDQRLMFGDFEAKLLRMAP